MDELEVEKLEEKILNELVLLFEDALDEFYSSINRSLKYLDKIILPIIMASEENKSYNPFSEIIEKHTVHILIRKLENKGYKLLPLGYSADLTMEGEDHILNIDVKTANDDNLSDFCGTINIGLNQLTHIARIKNSRLSEQFLPEPFYIYPTIPPYYEVEGRKKLVLTYGFLFIYPSYSEPIKEIRKEYDRFKKRIVHIIKSKLEGQVKNREELLAENIIRGMVIHEQERSKIIESLGVDKEMLSKFLNKLEEFANELCNVKPEVIIVVSIPNGQLKERYIDNFVSGKNYCKSARYYYGDGIFKIIMKKSKRKISRVRCICVDKERARRICKELLFGCDELSD